MIKSLRCLPLLILVLAPWARAGGMHLHVDAGDGHGRVRARFVYTGCGGQDVSPAVRWQGAPAGTRSFALTAFDPDANGGAGWWHWAVIDLPSSRHGLAEGATPPAPARSLRNDFGHARWDGPCPPSGGPPHHYRFTLYALDVKSLHAGPETRPGEILPALQAHALATAEAVFTYRQ